MTDKASRAGGPPGCLPGCGGFLFVLILGGALSLFDVAFGLGVSVRVPFTESNATAAGSIGDKERAIEALPSYTRDRVGGNQNVINHTSTLTIGPAEGIGLFILGNQTSAPALDLYVDLR